MTDLIENLKDAICANDFSFLEANKENYDINLQLKNDDNDTLVSYAIADAGNETYEFFLKNNADLTILNDEGENIIHSIVYSGKDDRINKVLEINPDLDINHKSKDGSTPILLSVLLEKHEIFNHLIELGVDVNIPDNEGNAPIHIACMFGYKEMVIKLVDKGANLSYKSPLGNFPLTLAVNGEHHEIVKYLFQKIYK